MNENVFEKKAIQILPKKSIEFTFEKQDILIYPYISLANETKVISDYCGSLFKDGEFLGNYIEAEYSLVLSILDLNTNIQITDENNIIIDLDDLLASGIWEQVNRRIENYDRVRSHLDNVVRNLIREKDLEKSIGSTIDNLSNKIFVLLDKIADLDLSEDGIKQLLTELRQISADFGDKFGNISTGGQ
jgi:hypothetical protein